MLRLIRLFVTLAVAGVHCAPHMSVAETLTIGTMNQGIRAQMKIYEPFAAYVEEEMRGTAVTNVRLMVVSSADQMADAIKRNEVDIFIDSPLVAGKVAKMSGAQPFLRRHQETAGPYFSVIIAHVNSGITTLDDLEGKTIAFSEPESSAGFLLPAHIIVQHGLRLREKLNQTQVAEEGEVNFVFSSHDKNTIFLIASQRVDAAATNLDAFQALRAARPGEYRVIASSAKFPRQVLLHRESLNPDTLSDVRSVLLGMQESEEGRNVLKKLQNTSAFDDFPDGRNRLFERINKILSDLEKAGIQ
ncbi:phosphate/phosphite/phosphonate ABC transporter substrate-binding protein [Shimia sp.]|uniref:phosphate/phosphite/phosphonate ABC transporter substrate-binding protein n=1 Tax=Shimia sp. TaxID=1954381 RepID=UPI003BAC26F9